LGGWFRPLTGRDPYNKKHVEDSAKATNDAMKVLEDHFLINTYLVGERITLADIMVASLLIRGFEFVFDAAWRKENPNVTRWYQTITNQSIYKTVAGEPKLIEEAIKYTPPKKEAKPKAEEPKKEAAKPKAKAADDDEEDEVKEEPKAKHPIEALGKATFAIDDWKRKYKNEETREVALPWFWENMNFEEYSIWSVDYKYNDELTQTFMTSNLIGGFFTRLEGSRKYIMGCGSVYGVKDDSVVKGAFVIRGDNAEHAFDVAPDYESYEFKKLDPKNEADREFVDSMWAWDKPVEVEGKKYDWADGKIFV
jgi:elongation factor 1-gamma